MISTNIGVWMAAILTLFVYSYFASTKQNLAFRFAQSTLVGLSLGYIVVLVMAKNIDSLVITKIAKGDWLYVVPFILGLLVYSRFVPRYRYLARIPIAIIVSVGLGLGARAVLDTDIFRQLTATSTMRIIGVDGFTSFSNLVLLLALICSSFYFFFTLSSKVTTKLRPVMTAGRYFLMIYFGARFGVTILSRLTLVLGRLQFLLYDWLGLG